MKAMEKTTEMSETQASHRTVVKNKEESRMKAIVYHTYGSPDVLQLEEVAKPTRHQMMKSWWKFFPHPSMRLTGIS